MKKNLHILWEFFFVFAPILLPIIIYLVAEKEVKYHAKKALWTHLIPYVTVIVGLAISGVVQLSTLSESALGIALLGTFAIAFILSIYYFIWNIVKGIKVLKEA